MQVSLIPVATAANPDVLHETTTIVFDVLRATSTIVTALASGYRRVYPVADAGTALVMAHKHGFVPAGERGGDKIAGFPHGNSPLEFIGGPNVGISNDAQKCNVLILTTTNGTKAIRWAESAYKVFTGSLLNARAVAQAVLREGLDVSLVCAGTGGRFSLEDTLGAGFVFMEIMKHLNGEDSSRLAAGMAVDDLPIAAYELARFYYHDPLSGLMAGRHGQRLLRRGLEDDLRWCAQLNRYDIAPVLSGEFITTGNDYTKQ
ncbi:putative 2-phosphosulfolactate phosphatase [Sporotomaculum syntrophicum]|uniref:Probable 2-phosphosulfolactate phosphatase n=1 Tax=Sporotomaculum syntrophicum TaxID=182264 RepID=A0A9D2WT57_9FIRM|nr:2-phosphosulfolactate phosphatase [Sporotomaculum syntrophicum]KAF1086451.1 putative 2-phosphosulfolactate phosphatase [Sporotomaculum syntrophicum]